MKKRTWQSLLTLLMVAGLGCSDGANSQAKRAEPADVASDAPAGSPDDSPSPHTLPTPENLPAGHPPIGGAGGPSPSSGDSSPQVTDGKLALDQLTFTVPESWQNKSVSSSFVAAEFTLPRAEGDDADGRLTVSIAGGSIEANVERWRGQFGGNPEKSTQSVEKVNGMDVTVVEFTGEFNDSRGPFAPSTPRSGYTMLAAIIPVEGELHFIKAVGPKATIAEHAERIRDFVGSAQKK